MPIVKATVPCPGMEANRPITVPADRPVSFAGEAVGTLVNATALDGAIELELLLSDAGVELLSRDPGMVVEEVPWAEG